MTEHMGDMRHIAAILQADSADQVWALHVARMKTFGFDRMIYGANRLLTDDHMGELGDAMILTNHDREYLEVMFGQSRIFHAPMSLWAASNVGEMSWQWAEDRLASGNASKAECNVMDLNRKMGVHAGYSISFKPMNERSRAAIGLCAERGLTQAEVDARWRKDGFRVRVFNEVMNNKIATLPFERPGRELTDRQREVLQWVADGKTIQDIALIMNLTVATVEKHLRLARERLDAETTANAVMKASLQSQFFLFSSSDSGVQSGNLPEYELVPARGIAGKTRQG